MSCCWRFIDFQVAQQVNGDICLDFIGIVSTDAVLCY